MELSNSDTLRLGELAVAAGATTPDPGARVIVWSTVESDWVGWDGSAWVLVNAGGGSTFTSLTDTPASYSGKAGQAPVVNSGATALRFSKVPAVYDVDFIIPYIETDPYFNETDLWSPGGSSSTSLSTIDLTHPVFTADPSAVVPTLNSTLLLGAAGLYQITDVSTPSAAVLTRVAEFPSGALIDYPLTVRSSTSTLGLVLAKAVCPPQRASFQIGTANVSVAANTITVNLSASFSVGAVNHLFSAGSTNPTFFRVRAVGTLPGGLTDGGAYWAAVVEEPAGDWSLKIRLYTDKDRTTPVVLSSTTGTDNFILVPLTAFRDASEGVYEVSLSTDGMDEIAHTVGTTRFAGTVKFSPFNGKAYLSEGLLTAKVETFLLLDFGTGAHAAEFGGEVPYLGTVSGSDVLLTPFQGLETISLSLPTRPEVSGITAPSNNHVEHLLALPTFSVMLSGLYSPGYASADPWPLEFRWRITSTEWLSGTYLVRATIDRTSFYNAVHQFP